MGGRARRRGSASAVGKQAALDLARPPRPCLIPVPGLGGASRHLPPHRRPRAGAASWEEWTVGADTDGVESGYVVRERVQRYGLVECAWLRAEVRAVVRLNARGTGDYVHDLRVLRGLGRRVILPETQSATDAETAAADIAEGVETALAETVHGVAEAGNIAACDVVTRLALCSVDLATQLRIEPDDRLAMLTVRPSSASQQRRSASTDRLMDDFARPRSCSVLRFLRCRFARPSGKRMHPPPPVERGTGPGWHHRTRRVARP